MKFIDNFLVCSESYAKILKSQVFKNKFYSFRFFFSFRYKTFIFYYIQCIYLWNRPQNLDELALISDVHVLFHFISFCKSMTWIVFFIKYYVCIQWNRFKSIIYWKSVKTDSLHRILFIKDFKRYLIFSLNKER